MKTKKEILKKYTGKGGPRDSSYSQASSPINLLKTQGYKTVSPSSYHYGIDAHEAWANHLTNILKESIIVK